MMMRQGDLFFQAVKSVPRSASKVQHRVLAEGEITGHSHQIEEGGVATVYENEDVFYVDVAEASVRVVHEEHGAIELPRGKYRVWRQREYTPAEIRRVVD